MQTRRENRMTNATSAHTAPLTKREEIAEGTMAFHFAKPADFQFQAGQSMDLTLLNPPETDAEGNSRAFSIIPARSHGAGRLAWTSVWKEPVEGRRLVRRLSVDGDAQGDLAGY